MRLRGFGLEAAGPSSLLRPAVSSRPGPASWNNPTSSGGWLDAESSRLRRRRAKLDPIKRSMTGRTPGTVLLGEMIGSATLKPGDFVINERGRFEIEAIEAFRELLDRVEPPRNIGLRLGTAVDRAAFAKGQQIRFER